jgi:CelD/BcsL family acetyltransferase involved in cellulose biosynthesis
MHAGQFDRRLWHFRQPMNPDTGQDNIEVFQSGVAQTPDLEAMWCDLQERADASMFISWSWIGTWLTSVPAPIDVQVVRAEQRGVVIGLALLVVAPLRRMLVPFGKVAHLHATGQAEFDGLAIEHNGLLLDRRLARAAQTAMLNFLCNDRREWRSVHFPGLTPRQTIPPEILPPSVKMEVHERSSAQVLLQPVRDRGGDYLGLLSAGRRAHIRRSMRACAEWGPLLLTQAEDMDSASAYFDRLLHLHRARRASLGSPSAFDTPFAREFHRRLIAQGVPRGEVQLVCVRAGEHEVGYLYSFVHRREVFFYQSGFDFGRVDHKFSPGLVTVALAIEHNARLGHRCFDFLAGDAQYKKTLATHSETMSWVQLQRDGPALRAETMLRAAGRRGRDWLRRTTGFGDLGLALVGALACLDAAA